MRFFLSEYRSRPIVWASGLLIAHVLGIAVLSVTWTIQPDPLSNVLAVKVSRGIEVHSNTLLTAGTQGWTPERANPAQRQSEQHILVIGVDGARLMRDLAGACDCLPILRAISNGTGPGLQVSTAYRERSKVLPVRFSRRANTLPFVTSMARGVS